MQLNSIADIYTANQHIDAAFHNAISTITDAEANTEIEGEKWTLAALIEHVAITEMNMAKICSKLSSGAKESGVNSDGSFALSPTFIEKSTAIADVKLEAPEFVRPIGGVPLAESLQNLNASTADLDAMRSDIENFELSEHTFPHPFIGDMTAAEWLLVAGRHKMRHIAQIEKLLEKVRK